MHNEYALMTMYIQVGGDNRYIDAELLLKQIARGLRGQELSAGRHDLMVANDGRVMLNGLVVYEPPRPQAAPPAQPALMK